MYDDINVIKQHEKIKFHLNHHNPKNFKLIFDILLLKRLLVFDINISTVKINFEFIFCPVKELFIP